MAYLPRIERRTEVLDAFIRIAGIEGFEGATVRRVSAELGMSAGNIHHLFGSAAELKREAFRHFAELEIAYLDAAAELPSPLDQLHAYLSSVAIGTSLPARRIWASAGQEAARDEDFAKLWAEEAEVWLHRITDLLVALSDGSAVRSDATAAAWRLMSFAVGVISFSGTSGLGIQADSIDGHISTLILYELRALQSSSAVQTRPTRGYSRSSADTAGAHAAAQPTAQRSPQL